ncbi:MAG TPA: hypothetical protein VFN10_13850 [Thermoanaerobaculia bacterium]|nr:hypothetical protein [Thermoanaerobaculia bacterium]
MITKSDWETVRQAMIAEDRARLGDPPTVEELERYRRGELSDGEAERIRELLVAYPEIARAMTAPFPESNGHLPAAESAGYWKALQARIAPKPLAPVIPLWKRPVWTAVAAAIALVFAALYLRTASQLRQTSVTLAPRVVDGEQELRPDGRRGPGEEETVLTAAGDSYVLSVALAQPNEYPRFRITLVNADGVALWSATGAPRENGTFVIDVPRAFLPAGRYQLVEHGLAGARATRLATYTVRVPKR